MLSNAKPMAALSSTLLARKGQARPAMRPQGYAGLAPAAQLEDLGWDDMGSEPAFAEPTPIAPAVTIVAAAPLPEVLVARAALREDLAAPATPPKAVKSVSIATAGRLRRETAHADRAAFTLRLDADIHLKLRLASAVTHRSAQQLVSHALDEFLLTLPEVDGLVAQLPPMTTSKRKR